ncbi:MAG: T9SS type A sorting domain-containing protein [bacterium]
MKLEKILFYVFTFALIMTLSNAKEFDKDKLPKLLGGGNVGNEFYFSFIPAWETKDSTNDLKIYISSNVRTKVTVEVTGKSFTQTKYTIPNDIIDFTLAPSVGQAYSKTAFEPSQPDSVWKGAGVHVFAESPIICVGATRFQYTTDAFLALPVQQLGKEYIVASYADVASNDGQWLPSYTSVTAPFDNTQVSFTMGGTSWSRTVSGLLPGQTSKWNLNKGDVLLISSLGNDAELSGSKIVSDKPVAVVSGNFCAYVPTNCGCCDVLEEMEIPTDYWGKEYHVTRIVNRLKNSIIKVFAKEANTKIFMDYLQIGFLRSAGGQEQDGYLHRRADVGNPRPIVISGDKPIGVTQFNTGQLDDQIVSDPFQIALVPVEQYQKEITFHTPGIKGGYGYPYNYINLCYEATPYGTIPSDLMFAQNIASQFEWTPIKDMSPTPGDPFIKVQGGKIFYSKTLLLPGDGVYKIKCSTPFAVYQYGFSWCDSYGFPASLGLQGFGYSDNQAPIPYWTMEANGNVNIVNKNYVIDQPSDILNRSNIDKIIMDNNVSFNYRLMTGNYLPCVDSSAEWSLVVLDENKDAFAVLTFSDCAGNDTTISIYYDNPNDSQGHDTLAPVPYWVQDEYGNINKDTLMYVFDKPDFDELRSNMDSIFLNKEKSYNYELIHQDFTKCQEQKLWWKLIRTDITQNSQAEVTFRDCYWNDTTLFFYFEGIRDRIAPMPEWIMDSSGNVNHGVTNYVEDFPRDTALRSNLQSIILHADVSYNYKLEYGSFIPCRDYKTIWKLMVIDANEDAYAKVTFTDCAGNDTTLEFNYNSKTDNEPPLTYWEMDESGNVNVKITIYVTDMPNDIGRRKNLDSIVIDENLSYNYRLFYSPYIRCVNHKTDWSLVILDSKKSAKAVVTFSDCAGNDTTLTIVYNPTDVPEDNVEQIKIIPNPANDFVHITGLPEGINQIKILDVLGNEKINYELPITNYEFVVDVKDLPVGVYCVQVDNNDVKLTRKFTILR